MKYLYNGAELPDINTIMADGYPYGLIYQKASTGAFYLLNCMDTANPAQGFLTYSNGNLVSTSGVGIYGTRNVLTDGAWVYEQTVMGKTLSLDGITLIWTNTDIPNADGSVYLAASEPVAVLARNPVLIMLGFQLGTAIRRMRGKKSETEATLTDGVLYIKKAAAILKGGILEVK